MTEKKAFLRRALEAMVESRRLAAQRRVDEYLEAIGLIEPRDRR